MTGDEVIKRIAECPSFSTVLVNRSFILGGSYWTVTGGGCKTHGKDLHTAFADWIISRGVIVGRGYDGQAPEESAEEVAVTPKGL